MILVILGISLLILGTGIFLYIIYGHKPHFYDEWIYCGFNTVGAFLTSICIIVTIALSIKLTGGCMTIDDKIAMYEKENQSIETTVNTIVKSYKDYESDIFENAKNQSPTVLVSLYPELKSDKLVEKQIEVYIENNNKIKELNIEKIDYKPIAWWLYFGNLE